MREIVLQCDIEILRIFVFENNIFKGEYLKVKMEVILQLREQQKYRFV